MRHAIVVAPPHFEVEAHRSVFDAPQPLGPLCAALARGGSRLLLVRATRDLAGDFEQALEAVDREDDLIVCLAAFTTTAGGGASLRLGEDSPGLAILGRLGDAISARGAARALLLVEATHDGDPSDPFLSAEHVDAILRALDARARGFVALVGARAENHRSSSDWPFLGHFLAAMGDPAARGQGGVVTLSAAYECLRSRETLDADVQSFALVRGFGDFPLADRVSLSSVPEMPASPTAVVERAAPEEAPPSVEPVTREADSLSATPIVSLGEPITPDPPRSISQVWPAPPSVEPFPSVMPPRPPASGEPAADAEPASVPTPRAPLASLPAIEPLLELAEGAQERGALTQALAGYKAALLVVAPSDVQTRAAVYLHLGQIKRAQGQAQEAQLYFEKALSLDPQERDALDALVELANEASDPQRAHELHRRRLDAELATDRRVSELLATAEAQLGDPNQLERVLAALDEAHRLQRRSLAALERLRAAYETLRRWEQVVDVSEQLAEVTQAPAEKSATCLAAADVALERLKDTERGLRLLERALEDDPTNDLAMATLVMTRAALGQWEALDAAYARRVDRLALLGDAERAWDACRKLGVLRRDRLRDLRGATEAFTGAVRCKPSDVDSRAMLAEMHLAQDDEPSAVAEFERIVRIAPTRSSPHARLFALHRRAGRIDRAWLEAEALEELGTADMDQQLVLHQYRIDGPIRPSRSLDDSLWDRLLRAPGSDDVVAQILRAIAVAAVSARVEELRQARQLVTLDPARRQSATSTVTAVRSFYWGAQVLGVESPDLYVMDNVPGGIAAVHSAVPTTALGPDVLRGLTTKDLAFLAGRHLTYYRPEHSALIYYPTLNDLSVLFLGAVKVVMPDIPVPAHMQDLVMRTRRVLGRQMSDGERRKLAAGVERLDARDGRADLAAWIRGVELTAQRAGLLLCGDLSVATSRLRAEAETRSIAELTFEAKRSDLLAFCASEELARARELLSVDAHKSVSGPPPATGELQAS